MGHAHTSFTNLPAIGGFWTDQGEGARIWHLRERVFMGAAAGLPGKQTPSVGERSWVGNNALTGGLMTYFESRSTALSISPIGSIAFACAARTSDKTESGGTVTRGSFCLNDDSSTQRTGWADYIHATRASGAGTTMCLESQIGNAGAAVALHPYLMGQTGSTMNLWLGCGGETAEQGTTVNPVSCCIGITKHPDADSVYSKGIVFQATALEGTTGNGTGTGIAIEYATGHLNQWRNSGGDATTLGCVGADVDLKAVLNNNFIIENLPTSNPGVAGAVYSDSGTLKIAA